MEKNITKKQEEILLFLYQFRFLNRIHVQHLMNHKNHSLILLWLADLVEKNYIGCIYNRRLGENTKPSIYFLKKNGLRFIKATQGNSNYLKRLIHEEKLSQLFMQHSLLVADIYVQLHGFAKENLTFLTQPQLPETVHAITPDAYFTYNAEEIVTHYFLEVDKETETQAKMRRKIQRYIAYYHSFSWKKLSKDYFPAVCFVCLTEERVKRLKKDIESLLKENNYPPIIFKITTYSQLQEKGFSDNICTTAFKKDLYTFL